MEILFLPSTFRKFSTVNWYGQSLHISKQCYGTCLLFHHFLSHVPLLQHLKPQSGQQRLNILCYTQSPYHDILARALISSHVCCGLWFITYIILESPYRFGAKIFYEQILSISSRAIIIIVTGSKMSVCALLFQLWNNVYVSHVVRCVFFDLKSTKSDGNFHIS